MSDEIVYYISMALEHGSTGVQGIVPLAACISPLDIHNKFYGQYRLCNQNVSATFQNRFSSFRVSLTLTLLFLTKTPSSHPDQAIYIPNAIIYQPTVSKSRIYSTYALP